MSVCVPVCMSVCMPVYRCVHVGECGTHKTISQNQTNMQIYSRIKQEKWKMQRIPQFLWNCQALHHWLCRRLCLSAMLPSSLGSTASPCLSYNIPTKKVTSTERTSVWVQPHAKFGQDLFQFFRLALTCQCLSCLWASELVGALSPENHRGLHQGWTQTSLYLQVIHFTSHHTTSSFLSLFIICGHSTREPASGRVTYFILWAYTGTMVSHSQHRKNWERFWKKCRWMDWKGRNKQGKIPGSKCSMYGYILTYFRL